MVRIVPKEERHFSDRSWLQTYWLFSFNDYYDPDNIQFGALRVFNDDVVAPGRGFPTHPHEEMEIVTIVLEGELTHKDTMGNEGVIRANDVQRMTAGRGLMHSEMNLGDKPVHLYQIWIYPGSEGIEPSYDQKSFYPSSWKNNLFPVASGQGISSAVKMNAEGTIYRSQLDAGTSLTFDKTNERHIFIYLTSGRVSVNGAQLNEKDQARIETDDPLILEAQADSELILIDVQ